MGMQVLPVDTHSLPCAESASENVHLPVVSWKGFDYSPSSCCLGFIFWSACMWELAGILRGAGQSWRAASQQLPQSPMLVPTAKPNP